MPRKTITQRLDEGINPTPTRTGCLEWTKSITTNGYGEIHDHGKKYTAHHLVWTHHNGTPPAQAKVCHTCGNLLCCTPEHLYLGTTADRDTEVAQGKTAAWEKRLTRDYATKD